MSDVALVVIAKAPAAGPLEDPALPAVHGRRGGGARGGRARGHARGGGRDAGPPAAARARRRARRGAAGLRGDRAARIGARAAARSRARGRRRAGAGGRDGHAAADSGDDRSAAARLTRGDVAAVLGPSARRWLLGDRAATRPIPRCSRACRCRATRPAPRSCAGSGSWGSAWRRCPPCATSTRSPTRAPWRGRSRTRRSRPRSRRRGTGRRRARLTRRRQRTRPTTSRPWPKPPADRGSSAQIASASAAPRRPVLVHERDGGARRAPGARAPASRPAAGAAAPPNASLERLAARAGR